MNKRQKYILIAFLTAFTGISVYGAYSSYKVYMYTTQQLQKNPTPKNLSEKPAEIVDGITTAEKRADELTENLVKKAVSFSHTKPEDVSAEEMLDMHLSRSVADIVPRLFAVGFSDSKTIVTMDIQNRQFNYLNGEVNVLFTLDVAYNGKHMSKLVQTTYDVESDQINKVRLSSLAEFGGN